MTATTRANFSLAPELVHTFNDWLKTAPAISKVEDAMRFGMGQMLTWRTLRARIGTADYVTEQPFFQQAPEGTKSREQSREDARHLNENDPRIKQLKRQRHEIVSKLNAAAMSVTANPFSSLASAGDIEKEWSGYHKELQHNDTAIARAKDANAAQAAGLDPSVPKPGNGPDDLVANDKTDLQEAAEEFRVLLTWLSPDQATVWRTKLNHQTGLPYTPREQVTKLHRPETPVIHMKAPDLLSRVAAVTPFLIYNDAVIKPRKVLKEFLRQHTSPSAVEALRKTPAAVRLYDDYIHDSRAWFRVPYFREYVPGGYFWARLLFIGGDQRVENLGMPPPRW
jgi:hypothetical protein